MTIQEDRNFDSLVARFEEKVYATAKGDWRLKLLQEDLHFLHQSPTSLNIWDAGCGFGQISYWLAQQGHQLTLCDLSAKMLARAQQQFAAGNIPAEFHHAAAQTLAPQLPTFDLLLLHAVLEWMVAPLSSLNTIAQQVKPGGYLSLLFYNRNAMIMKNILKGSWHLKYILDDSYLGKGKRLTPPNPQYPHIILEHLQHAGFSIITQTGIRVFHDYLTPEVLADSDLQELFELEYRHCRTSTFRDLGRYIHVLARREGFGSNEVC